MSRCADEFAHCTGIDGWHVCDSSKVKLRCILAALSRRNPGMAIRMIFDRTECPFDLKHPSIDAVADYLKKFALEVGA